MRLELAGKTDLALRALHELCADGERLAGSALAEILDTSVQYLPQVMSPLVHRGWVESHRGPNGGYRLVTSLDTISILDLIEAMEGETDTTTCVLRGGTCDMSDPCALHGAWSRARDALLNELSSMSISEGWDAC